MKGLTAVKALEFQVVPVAVGLLSCFSWEIHQFSSFQSGLICELSDMDFFTVVVSGTESPTQIWPFYLLST